MLYLVLLGGRHPKARLEVHDVVFVAGETLTATYADLKNSWFGSSEHLHIDGWQEVAQVDGYQVRVTAQPQPADGVKLFFIHHGGYLPSQFGEEHRYCLVVAKDHASAKKQAKQHIPAQWDKPHADHVELLDDVSEVTIAGGRQFITLQQAEGVHQNQWQNSYIVLSDPS